MGTTADEKVARQTAQQVLRECQISSLPVDLHRIASSKTNLLFETGVNLGEQAYGAFIYHKGHFVILISEKCPTVGHERFSFAHELGHFHLRGHLERIHCDGAAHFTESLNPRGQRLEEEANFFASELLMPRQGVEKLISRRNPGLASVMAISEACRTSIVSSALRYADCSEVPAAVVQSDGQSVSFARLSQDLWQTPSFRRNRPFNNTPVPNQSATADLANNPSNIRSRNQYSKKVPATRWFPDAPAHFELHEEARGLGRYGQILTVLTKC